MNEISNKIMIVNDRVSAMNRGKETNILGTKSNLNKAFPTKIEAKEESIENMKLLGYVFTPYGMPTYVINNDENNTKNVLYITTETKIENLENSYYETIEI